jgi:membrane-bound serine protease (ClpP class)
LGMLALFIEFKTPGFGIFGVTGIVLLGIVFLGNYVAGFSGHEPMIVFALGLLLVVLELLFFPGVAVVALLGLVMMLGSLVWAMADLWPGVPVTTSWSTDAFVGPLQSLGVSLVITTALAVVLLKYLPSNRLLGGLAIQGASASPGVGLLEHGEASPDALLGCEGIAVTALYPSGHVAIDDRQYEARVEVGSVRAGEKIRVVRRADFILIVEAIRT